MIQDVSRFSEPPFGAAEAASATVALSLSMLVLSVAGLAGWINAPVIVIAVLASLAAAAMVGTTIGAWRPAAVVGWLVAASGFLAIPMLTADAPPYAWDEVAYTAAFPKLYAAAGRIFFSRDLGAYSAFPNSYEALTTAAIRLTGSVVPMRVLGVLCFAAMGGVAACLASLLTARRAAACLAGLLVVSADVGTFANLVKNDFVNGLLHAAGILFVCAYLRQPKARWAMLAGMAIGGSCGIKYNSLQFGLCATLCVIPFLKRGTLVTERLRHFVVYCGAALATGGIWYARNLILFRNPFYPFFVSVLGDGTSEPKLFAAVAHETFYGYAGFSFGQARASVFTTAVFQQFGGLTVALAGAGLLVVAWRSFHWPPEIRDSARYLVLLTLAYSVICFFFGLWAPRYFIVLLVCYAALGGAALGEIFSLVLRASRDRSAIHLGLASLVGVALLYQTVTRQRRETGWLLSEVLAGKNKQIFFDSVINFANVADTINETLPLCAKVAIGLDVQPYYYVERRYYVMTLLAADFLKTNTPNEFAQRFRELELTHLAIQDWLGGDVYPEATDPNIYRFINRLYAAIHQLESDGRAVPIGEVNGLQGKKVRFYRLKNDTKTAHCV